MLLVQYGYDAETSPGPSSLAPATSSSSSSSSSITPDRRAGAGAMGMGMGMHHRRSSLGTARSEAVTLATSDRRPDVRLTQPFQHRGISYQQQLQQQQHDSNSPAGPGSGTGTGSGAGSGGASDLPPGSLLKMQSVLIQNHVLGVVKRYMKWLDELEESIQEGLEASISATADNMRVRRIEQYHTFLKQFHREVGREHRALERRERGAAQTQTQTQTPSPSPSPSVKGAGGWYTERHRLSVQGGQQQQQRALVRGLQKIYLQVSEFHNE